MKNLITISALIQEIFELIKHEHSDFPRVARSVRTAVTDMAFYSSSMIGFKSSIVVVKDNLTADLPLDCSGVMKVSKVDGKRIVILDRDEIIPSKETYKLRQTEFKGCLDCNCQTDCGSNTYTDPSSLPTAVELQTATIFKSNCEASTFHNCGSCDTLCAIYIRGYGSYSTDENLLYLSGVTIGDELLVEYKTEINAETYQLIPRAAFDVILNKAKTYLDPQNMMYEKLFRSYKKRFDLLKARELNTLEELFRALQYH